MCKFPGFFPCVCPTFFAAKNAFVNWVSVLAPGCGYFGLLGYTLLGTLVMRSRFHLHDAAASQKLVDDLNAGIISTQPNSRDASPCSNCATTVTLNSSEFSDRMAEFDETFEPTTPLSSSDDSRWYYTIVHEHLLQQFVITRFTVKCEACLTLMKQNSTMQWRSVTV